MLTPNDLYVHTHVNLFAINSHSQFKIMCFLPRVVKNHPQASVQAKKLHVIS